MRPALDPVDGNLPAVGTAAASARHEILGLLEELIVARHGTDAAEEWPH
ncbi:hypothetical protein ACFXPW_25500 [Streptomyces goshikiensis]